VSEQTNKPAIYRSNPHQTGFPVGKRECTFCGCYKVRGIKKVKGKEKTNTPAQKTKKLNLNGLFSCHDITTEEVYGWLIVILLSIAHLFDYLEHFFTLSD